ncbi:hypothetical protein [Nonomuraea sp. NPDC049400]|uniref:hypothetical protein n=1 Tax=Nonomuraea sp. NPDC049400 TaxID=3364352 RepID=UPI00379A640C
MDERPENQRQTAVRPQPHPLSGKDCPISSPAKNFLGIPVEGDICSRSRTPQKPLEELQPLLQALLDDPSIVSFGWHQYTPYFNDGDECVFGVGSLWVRTTQNRQVEDVDELEEYLYELEVGENPSLGQRRRIWNSETRTYRELPYEGPDEARYDRCLALSNAIGGGHFDDVLLEAFGDHAAVEITPYAIRVTGYEHD